MSDSAPDWPPRLSVTPEGAAGIYLISIGGSGNAEDQQRLAALFEEYWKGGYEAGRRAPAIDEGLIADLKAELESEMDNYGTHWDGCESAHPGCRRVRLYRRLLEAIEGR